VKAEKSAKPLRRQARNFLERSRLIEQVRGARYDRQFLLAGQLGVSLLVQAQDQFVTFSDDQQCRRPHTRQGIAGQVRPAPARDDRIDARAERSRGDQCRRSSSAGTKLTQPGTPSLRMIRRPPRRGHQPLGQQTDVKTQMTAQRVLRFLPRCEQVEQQRANSRSAKCSCHELVSRAVTAAPAAVREQNHSQCVLRDRQFAWECHLA